MNTLRKERAVHGWTATGSRLNKSAVSYSDAMEAMAYTRREDVMRRLEQQQQQQDGGKGWEGARRRLTYSRPTSASRGGEWSPLASGKVKQGGGGSATKKRPQTASARFTSSSDRVRSGPAVAPSSLARSTSPSTSPPAGRPSPHSGRGGGGGEEGKEKKREERNEKGRRTLS
uniref:Uncharacterized protein n=2 Tax=Palpitomonas bilix TaxID=652834 RepID=A0A7S3GCC0_9EUKA